MFFYEYIEVIVRFWDIEVLLFFCRFRIRNIFFYSSDVIVGLRFLGKIFLNFKWI